MSDSIRVVQCGLGPIGIQLIRLLTRRGLTLAGAVDIDAKKLGRDVGLLAGIGSLDVTVTENLPATLDRARADVVLLSTVSSLCAVKSQLLQAVKAGVPVVSTCEELSYPWLTFPQEAREIDRAASEAGVAVLGTGVNPGFLMDCLPLSLTSVCRRVESVRVERVQDASRRRLPFQHKIGAGLSPQAFALRVEDGTLRHVGLTESMHMIADRLGWRLERSEDVVEPILARRRHASADMTVEPGHALGVSQVGRAFVQDREVITLVFRAAIGEPQPYDRVVVQGRPSFESTLRGGIGGDEATCAITANAVSAILRAAPGLRTMADMPPLCCAG